MHTLDDWSSYWSLSWNKCFFYYIKLWGCHKGLSSMLSAAASPIIVYFCFLIAMLLCVTKWCMVPTSRTTLQYLKCKMPDLWNLKKFHHEAHVMPFTASGGAEPKSSCSSHHHQTLRFQGFKASLPGLQGWCRSLGNKGFGFVENQRFFS